MMIDNPFELAGWTLAQALVWIIYRTPEAVSRTAREKDVFDAANEAARREGVEEATISADLRKRFDLLEHLKRRTLTDYGVGRGQNQHNAIPTTSWHTIDSFYVYHAKSHIGCRDVGSSDESSPRYRDVFVLPNDVVRLWPPEAQPSDFEQPATSANEKDGDVPADVLASSTAAKARIASEGNIGGVSETARALAKSYFNEPRWPLRHALNWIACRKIEALLLTPEELRSLRSRARYNEDAGLVSKNPAHALLTALKEDRLRAIGPDHKELPPEFWDAKSFDPQTWPNVRFRRDGLLREWPANERSPEDISTQESARPLELNLATNSATVNVPHEELVAFYRDRFGAEGAATNREDMDREAERYFRGSILVKACAAARKAAGVKGRVGRPPKSGK
jgi:hypothetical protein